MWPIINFPLDPNQPGFIMPMDNNGMMPDSFVDTEDFYSDNIPNQQLPQPIFPLQTLDPAPYSQEDTGSWPTTQSVSHRQQLQPMEGTSEASRMSTPTSQASPSKPISRVQMDARALELKEKLQERFGKSHGRKDLPQGEAATTSNSNRQVLPGNSPPNNTIVNQESQVVIACAQAEAPLSSKFPISAINELISDYSRRPNESAGPTKAIQVASGPTQKAKPEPLNRSRSGTMPQLNTSAAKTQLTQNGRQQPLRSEKIQHHSNAKNGDTNLISGTASPTVDDKSKTSTEDGEITSSPLQPRDKAATSAPITLASKSRNVDLQQTEAKTYGGQNQAASVSNHVAPAATHTNAQKAVNKPAANKNNLPGKLQRKGSADNTSKENTISSGNGGNPPNLQTEATAKKDVLSNGNTPVQKSDETLAQFLVQHEDLRDWLEETQWHDTDYRKEVLSRRRERERERRRAERLRKIADLEATKQQLLDEEAAETGFPRQSIDTGFATVVPAVSTAPASDATKTPAPAIRELNRIQRHLSYVSLKDLPTGPKPSPILAAPTIHVKRERDDDGAHNARSYPVKHPRRGQYEERARRFSNVPDNVNERRISRPRDVNPWNSPSRHHPRISPPPARGGGSRRDSPPRYPSVSPYRSKEFRGPSADFNEPRGRNSYRRDDYQDRGRSRPRSPAWHGGRPGYNSYLGRPRGDLDRRGDTRYFVLKSFNEANVRRCMEDGIWSTQIQNIKSFTDAFNHCADVIFVFSINKSRAFQGYARMETLPSPEIPRPPWMGKIHWETSDPFQIQWLLKCDVSFHVVHHLKNSLNEDLSVIVGKDGQEIDPECGRLLLEELDMAASAAKGNHFYKQREGSPGPPLSSRVRGGYRGGRARGGASRDTSLFNREST